MKLLAVDSNSILNRAFYGIKLLTTQNGEYTNALFGFLNILKKVLDDEAPDGVMFAFDLKAPTFRHKKYDGYKANRKGMPEELAAQLPIIKEILHLMGYTIVEKEGYEADDIIGTIAKAAQNQGWDCVIVTGDRDSFQLIDEHITVRLAATKMGRPETRFCDTAYVKEEYHVAPPQLIDVKAIMGDTSDCIPGVAGIGQKGASDLIEHFGSLDGVYQNIDDPFIKPGMRQKLQNSRDMAYLSYDLAKICLQVPMDTDMAAYRKQPGDPGALKALLARLEMFTAIKKWGLEQVQASALEQEDSPAPKAAAKAMQVYTLKAAVVPPELKNAQKLYVLPQFANNELVSLAMPTEQMLFLANGAVAKGMFEKLFCQQEYPVYTDKTKELFAYAFQNGLCMRLPAFDCSLAAYLLNPNAAQYAVLPLAQQRGIEPVMLEGETEPTPLIQQAQVFAHLCQALEQEILQNEQQMLLHEIEIPLAQVLASMERYGFLVDRESIKTFGQQLSFEIEQIKEQIFTLAGQEFNLNSPKQLGEVLFEKLLLPTRKKTKTGYSTNVDVLESLKDKHPIIPYILEYRKLSKLVSTYVEGLMKVIGPDGRIHSSFQQTETRTGRISSTEPNMQNIPVRDERGSHLREFFVAPQGQVLVDADYSQIELRVLASIADDEKMIEAFNNDEDIHLNTAAQVFNLPPLFVTPQMRSRAKAVNFGIVYGIGAYSLSQDIGVSVAEADQYIKNYLKTYSGVKQYMADTVEFAKEHGYVKTLYGRRRYLPELSSSNHNLRAFGERVAMNTPIQGTAADIIKIAMVRVYNRIQKENIDARLILQVHDELIVECPEALAERVKALVKEEMEHAAQLKVKLVTSVNAGKSWYDAKD